ncbi:HutD family protein [Streptomyces sp. NRRL S-87]|uniref:HutD/Ves family protein n=1 Tax=Streptomyces sp. NRRL S-87 TaxID=1463920 RepID=UPI00099BB129|nr:HutD family protein [Streptomyces sp. NRRL S-87]
MAERESAAPEEYDVTSEEGAPAGWPVRVLRAVDRSAVPWKNGGGVTREIAAWPEGAGMDDFVWRVSLADVAADGPYSVFPAVDRTLTVVEGNGIELTVGGVRHRLAERYAPRDFPGDVPTDCRLLDGPVVNFNVMHRRGGAPADTAVVRGTSSLSTGSQEILLVVVLAGRAELDTGGRTLVLAHHDAALLGASAAGTLRSPGTTAVVRLPIGGPDRSPGAGAV